MSFLKADNYKKTVQIATDHKLIDSADLSNLTLIPHEWDWVEGFSLDLGIFCDGDLSFSNVERLLNELTDRAYESMGDEDPEDPEGIKSPLQPIFDRIDRGHSRVGSALLMKCNTVLQCDRLQNVLANFPLWVRVQPRLSVLGCIVGDLNISENTLTLSPLEKRFISALTLNSNGLSTARNFNIRIVLDGSNEITFPVNHRSNVALNGLSDQEMITKYEPTEKPISSRLTDRHRHHKYQGASYKSKTQEGSSFEHTFTSNGDYVLSTNQTLRGLKVVAKPALQRSRVVFSIWYVQTKTNESCQLGTVEKYQEKGKPDRGLLIFRYVPIGGDHALKVVSLSMLKILGLVPDQVWKLTIPSESLATNKVANKHYWYDLYQLELTLIKDKNVTLIKDWRSGKQESGKSLHDPKLAEIKRVKVGEIIPNPVKKNHRLGKPIR